MPLPNITPRAAQDKCRMHARGLSRLQIVIQSIAHIDDFAGRTGGRVNQRTEE